MDTEFILHTDRVKCVLPCHGSSMCDCLHGWDVIQINDTNEVCDIKIKKSCMCVIMDCIIGANE